MFDDLIARDELIAIAILVLGAIVARLASVATRAVLEFLDRRASRLATTETSLLSPRLIRVTSAIIFWLIVALAILFALQVLGAGGLSTAVAVAMAFIPQILVAFTIVVAGHVTGLVASHLVANLAGSTSSNSLGPRLVYGTIIVVAIVMGLEHIHVDISFITNLMLIAFAVAGAGLMLAFALGARQHVANLLARRELSRLSIGDHVRVDGTEGDVVDIHATGVDIATGEGVVSVPAAKFAETQVLTRVEKEQDA